MINRKVAHKQAREREKDMVQELSHILIQPG